MKRCLWAAGLSLGLAAGLPGCVAHARGEMVAEYPSEYVYPTEYVASVPVRIEYYPHTYYQGHPAYLVDGRWYYRNRERWVVFREEPAHLRHYRLQSASRYHASPSTTHSSYPRYAEGRESVRVVEHRGADRRRQEQHREQERRADQHREQQRAAEHGEADGRVAERRRATRQRERDRAEHESRPKERGRRDQRDDRRND